MRCVICYIHKAYVRHDTQHINKTHIKLVTEPYQTAKRGVNTKKRGVNTKKREVSKKKWGVNIKKQRASGHVQVTSGAMADPRSVWALNEQGWYDRADTAA